MPEERTYVILMIFILKYITQLMLDHLMKCKENIVHNMPKKLDKLLPKILLKKLLMKENSKELMEIKPLSIELLPDIIEPKTVTLKDMQEINI